MSMTLVPPLIDVGLHRSHLSAVRGPSPEYAQCPTLSERVHVGPRQKPLILCTRLRANMHPPLLLTDNPVTYTPALDMRDLAAKTNVKG
jgi:hypothetical protein